MNRSSNARSWWPALVLLGLPLQAAASAAGAAGQPLTVDPAGIEVGMFYDGTTVHISGQVPAGSEAAVVCSGAEVDVALNEKGRVAGVLWVNVGEAHLHAPGLYALSSSRPLAELAAPDVLGRLGIGYDSLGAEVWQGTPDERQQRIFGEFVSLRESEQLYALSEGQLQLGGSPADARTVTAECHFPAKALPGSYDIRLFRFHDGQGELWQSARLEVQRGGTAAFVTDLAQQHGLLYGILAVVIALVVGLLTGVLFGLGSKSGH